MSFIQQQNADGLTHNSVVTVTLGGKTFKKKTNSEQDIAVANGLDGRFDDYWYYDGDNGTLLGPSFSDGFSNGFRI